MIQKYENDIEELFDGSAKNKLKTMDQWERECRNSLNEIEEFFLSNHCCYFIALALPHDQNVTEKDISEAHTRIKCLFTSCEEGWREFKKDFWKKIDDARTFLISWQKHRLTAESYNPREGFQEQSREEFEHSIKGDFIKTCSFITLFKEEKINLLIVTRDLRAKAEGSGFSSARRREVIFLSKIVGSLVVLSLIVIVVVFIRWLFRKPK